MRLAGGWVRIAGPWAVDAALAVGLYGAALVWLLALSPGSAGLWPGAATAAVVCIAVAVRRRWPAPALLLAAAGGALTIPAGLVVCAAVAILATAYATGRTVARSITVVTALVAAVLFAGVAVAVAGSWWTGLAPMAVFAIPVGAAVGDAVRSSRDLVVALEDRARRRVADERLHIARDVHDVVAHHIAIVNVQAGVASHLLRDRPEAAEEALGHVTGASKAALDELGTLLGVLRGSGEPATPTEPTPGLADLEGLVASVAVTGLRVDRAVVGSPRPLSPAVDVSAYRIVQEALTNAGKYGTGRVRLTLTYTPEHLQIEVRNASTGSPNARAGHGLIGMRERVMAVGGEMTAGPAPRGEFAVRVRVPVPEEAP